MQALQFDKACHGSERAKRMFAGFDRPLALIVFLLLCVGIVTLYSASLDVPGRVEDQLRNIMLTFGLMWILANIPPQTLMRFAVPLYTFGVALLIAVATFGLTRKGAKRWLNVGVVIQPSEIMKIAMPLMLAWYFQRREGGIRWWDYVVGFLILILPVAIIAKQPDLGTAVLVFAAGLFVIYFAGLSFKLIVPILIAGVMVVASIAVFQERICQPEVNWPLMHDYQKHRICTLLDPTSDPLGKGFHTIQAVIAIGSGGTFGKGWLKGTQSHLEFIPEKHTDFIFAVFSEEFGLAGGLVLLFLYMALIARGLFIAANGATLFGRLLAGSLTMAFFTYAFVNIGMVSGILPVVGVPLPFMSYGGTALTTLGVAVGLIMSVSRQKRLMKGLGFSKPLVVTAKPAMMFSSRAFVLLRPFPREFRAELLELQLRRRIALRRRRRVIRAGHVDVLLHAIAAAFVERSGHVLRGHVPAFGRLLVPDERLRVVARRTAAIEELIGQRELRQDMALVRRPQEPTMRLNRITPDKLAIVVHLPVHVLRLRHVGVGRFAQPLLAFVHIRRAAFAVHQHHRVIEFGETAALLRRT